MRDLLDQITRGKAEAESQAERYLDRFIKVERPGNLKPISHAKPFVPITNSVGSEFHPLELLKPEILDARERQRCSMPDRSFAKDKLGLRMDFTSKPFPAPQPDSKFAKVLAKHMKERHRYMYPQ